MPRITLGTRLYTALNRLMLAQESPELQPDSIGREINYVIPWMPPSMLYEQAFEYESVASALGVNVVNGTTVPSGQLWFASVAESLHDDGAAAHYMQLRVQHVASANVATARSLAVSANQPLALERPLVIPAGHRLTSASADAIAAGAKVYLKYFYLRLRWGEPLPEW